MVVDFGGFLSESSRGGGRLAGLKVLIFVGLRIRVCSNQ